MTLGELESAAESMLNAFRLKYRKKRLGKVLGTQYVIEEFGILLCVFLPVDYLSINEMLKVAYEDGWRTVFFGIEDNVNDKRKELLWLLAQGGYFRWLRMTFSNQFRDILLNNNLSGEIINRRLEFYGDKPKYKFLKQTNEKAKTTSVSYILSVDPGFFDYIPE